MENSGNLIAAGFGADTSSVFGVTNNMSIYINSYMNMVADGAHLLMIISEEDSKELMKDPDIVYEWSKTLNMVFDAKKVSHVKDI